MKILLASLLCLVFGTSESFAISGGPIYGKSKVTVTGTYSGVFLPPTNEAGGVNTEADNSLALFTVNIPKTGLGTGIVAVFRNGDIYSGTMTATADPDSAKLYANVSATFPKPFTTTFTDRTPAGETPPVHDFGGACTANTDTHFFTDGTVITNTTLNCTFTYRANGTISDLHGVRISPNSSSFSTASARLGGTARLSYSTDDPNPEPGSTASVSYKVVGFKQAEITQ